MRQWEPWFPSVFEDLVAEPRSTSFFSPRETTRTYQIFGEEFTRGDLDAFIGQYVLSPGGPFTRLVGSVASDADLTVNVRRGDYYSVPRYRGRYSFDVAEYVRVAIARATAVGAIERILVVSDDLDWCRLKLGWLSEVGDVTYPPAGSSAAEQLAILAASRRLILANSTFSYWGGYLNDRARPAVSASERIWAPGFHSREWMGGAASQLDPKWSVVQEIPGGWDG